MNEPFTDGARKALQRANEVARGYHHEYIGTEHILIAILSDENELAAKVLHSFDVDPRKVQREIDKIIMPGPHLPSRKEMPQTPRAKRVVEFAIEEARSFRHSAVGTEHLLLGLLRESEGVAGQVLMHLGLKLDDLRKE